ncbi:putative uncharacterized protein [Staphylococcus equorum subsp. equorum Mu2]|nr:putative uncharacterized protein [Staphylococcus equorum subsp. equorum Mu2]
MNADKKLSELLEDYNKSLKNYSNMISQRHLHLIKKLEVKFKNKRVFLLSLKIKNHYM